MKGTFEYKLSDGRTCKLEVKYECVMEHETIYSDGIPVTMRDATPTEAGRCDLVAYIDGKKFDSCWNSAFWRLIDVDNGAKKIWGLKVGFTKPEDADRYEKWLADIMDKGTSDEVKAYRKAQEEKEIKAELDTAKKIIKKAENQPDLPSWDEARRRERQYNDIINEGGEGYVPHVYSREEYENAKKVIAKYEN